jgi:pyruvate formate lyase activating enzyme
MGFFDWETLDPEAERTTIEVEVFGASFTFTLKKYDEEDLSFCLKNGFMGSVVNPTMNSTLHEAKLYRRAGSEALCQLCWRFCKIKDGYSGFCKVRVNKGGRLYTLTYGKLSALESRPIEIKPFFHFLPGSTSMTFSTYSCNLTCPWCQNWRLSKSLPDGQYISPHQVVERAMIFGDDSTCASLNEPTLLFEYLLDVFSLAQKRGLMNTMVSNGYMSVLALKELERSGLNALNVDVKGDEEVYERYCGGRVKYVWKVISEAIKLGIHVEVVCLVITDINDSDECLMDIVENHLRYAGGEIPIHFTRYFPAYKFKNPPTPVETLEKAIEMAKRRGISFAYIGNVPGHRYENTYCPECGETLVKRYHVRVFENRIENGRCWRCGREIYGIWIKNKIKK